MFKVLIVDQFSGVSPYLLQKTPIKFDSLVAQVMARQASRDAQGLYHMGCKPHIREVDESFVPAMCTTVIRDVDGVAEVWKYRWDSSG